jgi:ABC-type polysaccharide/polyol phosphate export permease
MLSTLPNVLARRDLLRALTASELQRSVAGSRLGWLWWFFDPVLMMLVYWAIVVGLFGHGDDRYAPYPLFLFCALVTWKHFSTAVGRAMTLLRGSERLIKSVAFPTVVLPLSVVFSGFVYFLAGFGVLLLACVVWPSPHHTGSLLPILQVVPLMLLQIAITAGVCMAMSCYGALLQDLRLFVTHVLRVGFYLSPGLYSVDSIREKLAKVASGPWADAAFALYMANPFALLITGYRDAVLYGRYVPLHWWPVLLAEAALVLWWGYRVYQHHDRRVIKFL